MTLPAFSLALLLALAGCGDAALDVPPYWTCKLGDRYVQTLTDKYQVWLCAMPDAKDKWLPCKDASCAELKP